MNGVEYCLGIVLVPFVIEINIPAGNAACSMVRNVFISKIGLGHYAYVLYVLVQCTVAYATSSSQTKSKPFYHTHTNATYVRHLQSASTALIGHGLSPRFKNIIAFEFSSKCTMRNKSTETNWNGRVCFRNVGWAHNLLVRLKMTTIS